MNASPSFPSLPAVSWNQSTGEFSISYLGETIFAGKVAKRATVTWQEESKPAEPLFLGYSHGPRDAGGVPEGLQARSLVVTIRAEEPVTLDGKVFAGADALACIPDGGPGILRGSVGQSASLLNRGVFDRSGDWALYVADPAKCVVTAGKMDGRASQFELKASGSEIKLVLDEEFIRVHRGYFHWSPAKKLWEAPVAGWCSWAAHGSGVKEEDIVAVAELFSRELRDYGYDVIQIDDGFQLFNQSDPKPLAPGETIAEYWLNSNDSFPHGMEWIAEQISSRGLTPGMWMSTALALGLPDEWYVTGPDGKPFRGQWANWTVNGLIPDAVEAAFRKTFRGFKEQGWRYFKVDTLRHVVYDNYRLCPDYWRSRGEDSSLAFRAILQGIKEEIGPDIYMLSCWGTIPEMAGIPDGCRIGEDVGVGWGSATNAAKHAAQFYYLNNIVWRNDPDYMCFRGPLEHARSWATLVALTGQQIMVSDPAESYDEPRLDILRKVGPSLFVRPTTLHALPPDPELTLLELDGPDAPYCVLGRIAWPENGLPPRSISFADLGLDPSASYLVWDFWNEKLVGEFRGEFPSDELMQGDCRTYAVRPALSRPQVLSTNRHISQGAYELSNVLWRDDTLCGKMKLPANRPLAVYIHVPDGYKLASSSTSAEMQGRVLRLTLKSDRAATVDWSARFTR